MFREAAGGLDVAAQEPDHVQGAARAVHGAHGRRRRPGCEFANKKLALAITPYFFNLIDRADPDCPIRKQVIPARRR